MKKLLLILLGGAAMLTGCAANGPAFTAAEKPQPGKSQIYFYRPGNLIGCAMATRISIDEVEQGKLKDRGYFVRSIEPGKRIIDADYGVTHQTIYLDIVPDEEYYVRWYVDLNEGYGISHTMSLALIPEIYALREIQYTNLSE